VAATAVLELAGVAYACHWILYKLSYVSDVLHKDVTLTGRLYIWILGTVMALRQPWLGYGYSAFWLGPKGPSARIWVALKWAAPGAHNGLLELWLDLGLLGIIIFLIGFVVYAGRVLRAFRKTSAPEREWPLIFFAFLVLMNLTESALLGGNSIFWTLYVAAAVCVSPMAVTAKAPKKTFGMHGLLGPAPNVANGQL
jgi:O-antigen ligase